LALRILNSDGNGLSHDSQDVRLVRQVRRVHGEGATGLVPTALTGAAGILGATASADGNAKDGNTTTGSNGLLVVLAERSLSLAREGDLQANAVSKQCLCWSYPGLGLGRLGIDLLDEIREAKVPFVYC
jgi:hypothetical protein